MLEDFAEDAEAMVGRWWWLTSKALLQVVLNKDYQKVVCAAVDWKLNDGPLAFSGKSYFSC